ncbi:uncharacterized protein [Penaeus vannamei]|uniref:uncharacterized protein isoform X2 n=1 Tax=Penaeus vannamei TaxID=6689 RepID=UPI00387F61D5
MISVSRQSRTRSVCQRLLQWASCRVPACLSSSACSESVDPSFSRQRSSLSKELRGSRGSKRGIASGAMAGWRRVVAAALLQLAFSRVLPADGSCYERGEQPIGRGYFNCSEPRLNFNDTQKELTMDFRNRNKNIVFTLSVNRTAGAFYLITRKDNEVINRTKLDLPDSSNELQLNINRSSVHAKTRGRWRKLDIPKTDEIFFLYIRFSHPPFCITCHGGDIWDNDKAIQPDTEQGAGHTNQATEQNGGDIWDNDKTIQPDTEQGAATEQNGGDIWHNDKDDTTQNTEQGVVQTTRSTEQGVVQTTRSTEQSVVQTTQNTEQGIVPTTQTNEQDTEHQTVTLWPLCFILLPLLGLLLCKRTYLCGKMHLLCHDLRTCCRNTKGTTTGNEQEMSGRFHQAREEGNGMMHDTGNFEADEVETENDTYISADVVQGCGDEEYETVNDIYISADVHQSGSNEYETLTNI